MDIVKILMGIKSSRKVIRTFAKKCDHWTKCQKYDYEEILLLVEEISIKNEDEICKLITKKSENLIEIKNKRRKINEEREAEVII